MRFRYRKAYEQSPEPCLGCAEWLRCKYGKLACRAFVAFVHQGLTFRPSTPTRSLYERLFGETA